MSADQQSAPLQNATRHRRERLAIGAVLLLWLLWVCGQVCRDATWISGALFYIPSPVCLLLVSACACFAWRRERRRTAAALVACALVPGVFVLGVENRLTARQQAAPSGEPLRLVHWNVCRGHAGWSGLAEEIRRCAPDLCVLSEIPKTADISQFASSLGQDYSGIRFSNLAVVAHGLLQGGEWLHRQRGRMKVYGVLWQSPQGMCRAMVVDLDSNPFLARELRLLVVRKLMVDWRADIVAGDFNAPRRSRALSPLPTGFSHAYDAVGSGWSYTWPLPCPVYAIDQCILGARVRPLRYHLESSWRSDHRRQILEFTLEPKAHPLAAAAADRPRPLLPPSP